MYAIQGREVAESSLGIWVIEDPREIRGETAKA